MDNIKLLNDLNEQAKPFKVMERSIAKKRIIDFYGRTENCQVYLKDYIGCNSPENVISGYFVSDILKSDPMNGKYYLFSVKDSGLKKSNIRIKPDKELIRIFSCANLEIIESQCDNLFTDHWDKGRVYYARSRSYGLLVFRLTDVFDNTSGQGILLKSRDESLLNKKINIYVMKDKSFIIEYI